MSSNRNYNRSGTMSNSRTNYQDDLSTRSRSSNRNNNYDRNQRPQSYDRNAYSNYYKKRNNSNYTNTKDDTIDDYVDCKAILDNERNNKYKETTKRNVNSPMKRNNDDRCHDENSLAMESPKKRIKGPQFSSNEMTTGSNQVLSASAVNMKRFTNLMSCHESPKRSTSLCEPNQTKKSFASTPKSERKNYTTRVKELMEQNSIAIERNLSNNWADIIEELEEQSKELNEFVEKVTSKYGLDREKLLKNIEVDTETLRKRQKRINFGKVTAEYQRYILALPRKKRQPYHPRTPNKFRKCSRRKFDGQIKKWRKLLHVWDENPDLLPEMKSSIDADDDDEKNLTDDFGGASNITSSDKLSYNLDDYDILDSDADENKLVIDAM